jgi:hypothetical protein
MTKPAVPDFKIRVIDEDSSRAIQEELLRRGVKWRSGYEGVQNYRENYLYVLDGRIVFGHTDSVFQEDKSEEHTFTNDKFSFDKEEAQPDADGWIEWKGGECPVADGVMVDHRLSSGEEVYNSLGQYRCWKHFVGSDSNIIAYRIHKPKSDSANTPAQEQPTIRPKKEWQQDRLLDVLKEMTRLVEQADYDTVYDLLTDEAAPLVNDLKWK